MTITRVGTTKKYADGWKKAFGGKKKRVQSAKPTKVSGKRTTKKKAKKRRTGER